MIKIKGADRNGYVPSIMDTEPGICYLCGAEGDTVRHEVFYGRKNRRMSKEKGTWVNVCPHCHRIVHEMPDNGRADRLLKRETYRKFVELHSKEIFFANFGRYYD